MARREYDKPSERLMIALEHKAARLLAEADVLELVAARLRTEARRSGELAQTYGTLPPHRLRPLVRPPTARTRKEDYAQTHNAAPGGTPDAA